MTFNFGFVGEKLIPIGSFAINKAALNYLQLLDSPSAAHLKRELAYINPDKLKFISNISKHMKSYHPGNTDNRSFKIVDGVLQFGYQGLGTWSEGKLQDLATITEAFRQHLSKIKGSEQLEMSITTDKQFWLFCNIKVK
jgi:hypothetical protein